MSDRFYFSVRDLKTCWFSTLRDLGFRTTLSLHNPLPYGSLAEDDLSLELDLFDTDGSVICEPIDLGMLAPDARCDVNIDDILQNIGHRDDVVGALRMIPNSLSVEKEIETNRETLAEWTACCDEFVGYTHVGSGVKSGVLYQSPPMNDSRLSSTNTIIIQSPKLVIDANNDSHLLLFCPTSNRNFMSNATLRIAILNRSGSVVARSQIVVPARGRRRVSISKILQDVGELDSYLDNGGFGMLVGLASGAVLTPLSLIVSTGGGLAIDHTLPPPYYAPWWGGSDRKRASQSLIKKFFPEAAGS